MIRKKNDTNVYRLSDRRSQSSLRSDMPSMGKVGSFIVGMCIGLIICAILLLVFLGVASSAQAHEGDSSLALWYRSLRSPERGGGSCCNMKDCHPTDSRTSGDHWEVPKLNGEGWEPVPDLMILNKKENPEHRAVVCRSPFNFTITCFVLPDGV